MPTLQVKTKHNFLPFRCPGLWAYQTSGLLPFSSFSAAMCIILSSSMHMICLNCLVFHCHFLFVGVCIYSKYLNTCIYFLIISIMVFLFLSPPT
ncbi:hypothetical protein Tsubulata_049357 [Turnera subulata]|uniref:Uncharacterized protein n=1 Tax=Turnera subulata TaxID=218843 RepID=A0A9Q0JM98_9ROSI|nr:hypothetical protein Tsubulata_049357 [Turnera subulata]